MKKAIWTYLFILVLTLNFVMGAFLIREYTKDTVSEVITKHSAYLSKQFGLLEEQSKNNLYIPSMKRVMDRCAESIKTKLLNEYSDRTITLKLHNTFDGDKNEALSLMEYIEISGYNIGNEFKTSFVRAKSEDKIELTFNKTVNTEKLKTDIVNILGNHVKEMIPASGKFDGSKMVVTNAGKIGINYSEESVDMLVADIREQFNSVEIPESFSIDFSFDEIAINPSAESLSTINSRLSTFSTGFNPNGSRGTNVKVATRNINGALVAPGETISIDKLMKSRNKANGYMPAGSYLNGKTVQTYGGGICQVSTTLYGAILRAGIIPVERNAHSMSVSYVPLGLDAAISEGYKDLKIKNTYDLPIYIQGVVNGGTVTFNIYGNESLLDGYTYKPVSTSNKSGLQADSWLQKIKDGKVVEKMHLFKSNYRPHR